MKTLDEVIEYFNNQCQMRHVYLTEDADARFADALHYLKELRDMTDIPMEYFENGGTSQKLRNTSQITCPKCHSEFVILDDPDGDHQQLEKCRALLQDFYRNDPISWDELKQMEGKPVWVENQFYKRWLIAYKVNREDIIFDGNGFYTQAFSVDYGKAWQAYRKERG